MNEPLLRIMEKVFQGSGLDMNVITAMMISSIYYLIIRRNRSTFCEIDFSTRKGKARLEEAINQLSTILFAELKRQHEKTELANRLRAEGVSESIINKCLNLPA